MPFTKQHSAFAWVVTCILFLTNLTFHNLSLHSSHKFHQPIHRLSFNIFLELPYSELLEKRVLRSRANRRLVLLGGKTLSTNASFIFKLLSKGDQLKAKLANLKFSKIGDGP